MSVVEGVILLCSSVFLAVFGWFCVDRPEAVLRLEARLRYRNAADVQFRRMQVGVTQLAGVASLGMAVFAFVFGIAMLT